MIDLYNGVSPNVLKATIFLEEAALPYRNIGIDLTRGDQFRPEFLAISPNHRIPVIIDHDPQTGDTPIVVWESGAILTYLAEKTGLFLPVEARRRVEVFKWLFWQVGGLGPMSGQLKFFNGRYGEVIPFGRTRYTKEIHRLYRVLNHQLTDKEFVTGEYSIADMACYPWIALYKMMEQSLDGLSHLRRWHDAVGARPAVRRAYERNQREFDISPAPLAEQLENLFGPNAPEKYNPPDF